MEQVAVERLLQILS